ncbi:MAG: hypothetical protein J7L44_04670 [Candidatus Diapherotrites archaeon]|nr:hypothetical protein [Candidatus Diapherotrites archaeon]
MVCAFAQSSQPQVEVADRLAELAEQIAGTQPQPQMACAPAIIDVKVNGVSGGTIKIYESAAALNEVTNNIEISYDLGDCIAQEVCFSVWRTDPFSALPSPRATEDSKKAAVVKWWLLYGAKDYVLQNGNFEQFFIQSIGEYQYELFSGTNWFPHNLYDVQCKSSTLFRSITGLHKSGTLTGQDSFSFTFSKSAVDSTNPAFLDPSLGSFGNSLYFTVQVRTAPWNPANIASVQDMTSIPWHISNAFSVPFDASGLTVTEQPSAGLLHQAPGITARTLQALSMVPESCVSCSSVIHCLACLDSVLVASLQAG